MSALLFRKGKQKLIDGTIDLDTDSIKLVQLLLDGSLTDTYIKAVTGCTVATPGVLTVTAHGWDNGDIICVRGVGGTLNANGLWQMGGQTTNNFQLLTRLDGLNSTTVGAYTSGGCAINLTKSSFLSEIDGAQVGALSSALGTISVANGIFDAADVSMTLNGTIHGHALIEDTGSPATSGLIHFFDGQIQVEVVADAASSATVLWVNRLEGIIPNGTVLRLSNGINATLTAQGNAGARSLSVSALSGAVAAGHTADAFTLNAGYPLALGGGTYQVQFDNGAAKIFEV